MAQVRATVPQASPPTSDPAHLSDGAVELLGPDGIELVGKRFAASFFFQNEKLSQVTLSLEKGHSFQSAMLVFDSLSQALRAKFEREIDHRVKRGILNTTESQWHELTMANGQTIDRQGCYILHCLMRP